DLGTGGLGRLLRLLGRIAGVPAALLLLGRRARGRLLRARGIALVRAVGLGLVAALALAALALLLILVLLAHLSSTPSQWRHTRTLRPSPSVLWPMRVRLLHSPQTII